MKKWIRNIVAGIISVAVAGISLALPEMVHATSTDVPKLTAYIGISARTESAWGPGEMNGISPTLTGDGSYSASVTFSEGSESIELLMIEVENLNLYDFAPEGASADAYGMPDGCTVGFTVDSIEIKRSSGGTDTIEYTGPSVGAYRASDDGCTLRMNILNTWGNDVADINGDLSAIGGVASGDTLIVNFTITGIDSFVDTALVEGTLSLGNSTIEYVPGKTTYTATLPLTCDIEADAIGIGILPSEEITMITASDGVLEYKDGLYWYSNAFETAVARRETIDTFTFMVSLTDEEIAALDSGETITIPIDLTKKNASGNTSAYISETCYGSAVGVSNGTITIVGYEEHILGDIDGDGEVTPIDAHDVLVAYSNESLTGESGLLYTETIAGDVNEDGAVDPTDAYYILVYYAQEQVGLAPTWKSVIG